MREKRRRRQVLHQPTFLFPLRRSPQLVRQPVPLGVKGPENRMRQPLRFHGKPQLRMVGGQSARVFDRVRPHRRLQAGCALFHQFPRILPRIAIRLCFVECQPVLHAQRDHGAVTGLRTLVSLRLQPVVGLFHRSHGLFLGRRILRADGLGAVPGFPFEQPRQAALPAGYVGHSRANIDMEGDQRCFVPLQDNPMQTVGKAKLRHLLPEPGAALRRRSYRGCQSDGPHHKCFQIYSTLLIPLSIASTVRLRSYPRTGTARVPILLLRYPQKWAY